MSLALSAQALPPGSRGLGLGPLTWPATTRGLEPMAGIRHLMAGGRAHLQNARHYDLPASGRLWAWSAQRLAHFTPGCCHADVSPALLLSYSAMGICGERAPPREGKSTSSPCLHFKRPYGAVPPSSLWSFLVTGRPRASIPDNANSRRSDAMLSGMGTISGLPGF